MMTDLRHVDSAVQDEQREQTRLALGATLIPLFFVTMFALCIIGTYHRPHPNGIKVGIVGPPAQTAPLRAAIEKEAGSAFDVRQVTTVAVAAHDVRMRDLNAAFVPTPNAKQPPTVIVAGPAAESSLTRPRPSPGRSPRPRGRSWWCVTFVPWRPATRSGSASSCS